MGQRAMGLAPIALLLISSLSRSTFAEELPAIAISANRHGFVHRGSDTKFRPWGFNYDHDETGRLLEDYWHEEWPKVEADFAEMKELGANVVRIHLQVGKFLESAEKPNRKSLAQLAKLVKLAEKTGLYLDLTGLGCYHKQDVPPWYDELSEADRWEAQALFWEAVAAEVAASPAIFCYDLMNEPVVPGGKRKGGEWLGPAFGGKHFVQMITLDQQERKRPDIARAWIEKLVAAIRKHDREHLITVGMVDWSLERPGLTSGFVPSKVSEQLDFLCIHLYPETGKEEEATEKLAAFAAVGKPVVVEETFPLKTSSKELVAFIEKSEPHAAGWISFYWGKTPAELEAGTTLGEAIQLEWLREFTRAGKITVQREAE